MVNGVANEAENEKQMTYIRHNRTRSRYGHKQAKYKNNYINILA